MTQANLKPGWKMVKFGEVVTLYRGHVHEPEAEGLERYIGIEHIEPEDLKVRSWGLIAEGTTFTNHFKPGQVLFVKRRAYQRKVAVAEFEGVCSGDIYVLEPTDPTILLPDLLPFICQSESFFQHAVGTSAGSLSPRTNWKQLSKYQFPLPPLDQQRRLAEVLWANLDVIENYRNTLNSMNICLKAIREHLFDSVRTRKVQLRKILKNIEAGKSLVGINESPTNQEKAVLKVSAVGNMSFLPEETKVLTNQSAFMPEYAIKTGDLLISRANTPDLVGMVCYVEQNYPNLMLSDKTLRLIPNDQVVSKLLWEALQTESVRQQIKSLATGTGAAMKNISQKKIRNLSVQLPEDTSATSPVLVRLTEVRVGLQILQNRLLAAKESLFFLIDNELSHHRKQSVGEQPSPYLEGTKGRQNDS